MEDEPWVSVPAYTLITEGKLAIPIFVESTESQYVVFPPLLQLFLAPVFKCFGVGLIQARLSMVFFGLLTVLLTYKIAKLIMKNNIAALLATFFIATENLFFLASRTVRQEIIVTFFTLLAFYLFILSTRKKEAFALLSGIAIAASMSTHPNGFLGFVSIFILFLYEYKFQVLKKRNFYLFLLGTFLGSIPYLIYVFKIDSSNGFLLVKSQMFGRNKGVFTQDWLLIQVKNEISRRYRDFLQFPYRLHIAVGVIVAILLGLCKRKKEYLQFIIIIFVHLFLFIFMVNHNVRYMAIISPYVSLLLASLAIEISMKHGQKKRWIGSFIIVTSIFLFGITQLFGNTLYLYKNKDTNYYRFIEKIKRLIPPNASIYGVETYWFGFYDRPYYAYRRCSYECAVKRIQPEIMLLDDRVMMNLEDWVELRNNLHNFMDENGVLLGVVKNHFYGDVKVYKVSYDNN